jgi:hypothetical protein
MLARLQVSLPFWITIPQGQEFPIHEYEIDGYTVRVCPPARSEHPALTDPITDVKLDGAPALRVDVLHIEFQKDTFDRRRGGAVSDPPEHVVQRVVGSFLLRFRHVARAADIRAIDSPSWHVHYLTDDGGELEIEEGLARAKRKLTFSVTSLALHKLIWEDIHSLPPDYEPPPWEELLLDAHGDLPRIGPAVVLAATALEVFISRILDGLASKGSVAPELWEWINDRGDYLREPRVEEQFDVLLRFFTGRSLKSEPRLWEAFRNLKTARNSFVHEGRASIGGVPVSVDTAKELLRTAGETVATIREWLPVDLQWKVFKHEVKIDASMQVKMK